MINFFIFVLAALLFACGTPLVWFLIRFQSIRRIQTLHPRRLIGVFLAYLLFAVYLAVFARIVQEPYYRVAQAKHSLQRSQPLPLHLVQGSRQTPAYVNTYGSGGEHIQSSGSRLLERISFGFMSPLVPILLVLRGKAPGEMTPATDIHDTYLLWAPFPLMSCMLLSLFQCLVGAVLVNLFAVHGISMWRSMLVSTLLNPNSARAKKRGGKIEGNTIEAKLRRMVDNYNINNETEDRREDNVNDTDSPNNSQIPIPIPSRNILRRLNPLNLWRKNSNHLESDASASPTPPPALRYSPQDDDDDDDEYNGYSTGEEEFFRGPRGAYVPRRRRSSNKRDKAVHFTSAAAESSSFSSRNLESTPFSSDGNENTKRFEFPAVSSSTDASRGKSNPLSDNGSFLNKISNKLSFAFKRSDIAPNDSPTSNTNKTVSSDESRTLATGLMPSRLARRLSKYSFVVPPDDQHSRSESGSTENVSGDNHGKGKKRSGSGNEHTTQDKKDRTPHRRKLTPKEQQERDLEAWYRVISKFWWPNYFFYWIFTTPFMLLWVYYNVVGGTSRLLLSILVRDGVQLEQQPDLVQHLYEIEHRSRLLQNISSDKNLLNSKEVRFNWSFAPPIMGYTALIALFELLVVRYVYYKLFKELRSLQRMVRQPLLHCEPVLYYNYAAFMLLVVSALQIYPEKRFLYSVGALCCGFAATWTLFSYCYEPFFYIRDEYTKLIGRSAREVFFSHAFKPFSLEGDVTLDIGAATADKSPRGLLHQNSATTVPFVSIHPATASSSQGSREASLRQSFALPIVANGENELQDMASLDFEGMNTHDKLETGLWEQEALEEEKEKPIQPTRFWQDIAEDVKAADLAGSFDAFPNEVSPASSFAVDNSIASPAIPNATVSSGNFSFQRPLLAEVGIAQDVPDTPANTKIPASHHNNHLLPPTSGGVLAPNSPHVHAHGFKNMLGSVLLTAPAVVGATSDSSSSNIVSIIGGSSGNSSGLVDRDSANPLAQPLNENMEWRKNNSFSGSSAINEFKDLQPIIVGDEALMVNVISAPETVNLSAIPEAVLHSSEGNDSNNILVSSSSTTSGQKKHSVVAHSSDEGDSSLQNNASDTASTLMPANENSSFSKSFVDEDEGFYLFIEQIYKCHDKTESLQRFLHPHGEHYVREKVDDDGNTLLHHAVQCAAVNVIHFLFELGANPDVRNHDGLTPLHLAVVTRAEAERIVDEKRNVVTSTRVSVDDGSVMANAPSDHAVVPHGRSKLLYYNYLLSSDGSSTITPSQKSSANGSNSSVVRMGVVSALIAGGATVDFPSFDNLTPLHLAVRLEEIGIVNTLLRAGADPWAQFQTEEEHQLVSHFIPSWPVVHMENRGEAFGDCLEIKENMCNEETPLPNVKGKSSHVVPVSSAFTTTVASTSTGLLSGSPLRTTDQGQEAVDAVEDSDGKRLRYYKTPMMLAIENGSELCVESMLHVLDLQQIEDKLRKKLARDAELGEEMETYTESSVEDLEDYKNEVAPVSPDTANGGAEFETSIRSPVTESELRSPVDKGNTTSPASTKLTTGSVESAVEGSVQPIDHKHLTRLLALPRCSHNLTYLMVALALGHSSVVLALLRKKLEEISSARLLQYELFPHEDTNTHFNGGRSDSSLEGANLSNTENRTVGSSQDGSTSAHTSSYYHGKRLGNVFHFAAIGNSTECLAYLLDAFEVPDILQPYFLEDGGENKNNVLHYFATRDGTMGSFSHSQHAKESLDALGKRAFESTCRPLSGDQLCEDEEDDDADSQDTEPSVTEGSLSRSEDKFDFTVCKVSSVMAQYSSFNRNFAGSPYSDAYSMEGTFGSDPNHSHTEDIASTKTLAFTESQQVDASSLLCNDGNSINVPAAKDNKSRRKRKQRARDAMTDHVLLKVSKSFKEKKSEYLTDFLTAFSQRKQQRSNANCLSQNSEENPVLGQTQSMSTQKTSPTFYLTSPTTSVNLEKGQMGSSGMGSVVVHLPKALSQRHLSDADTPAVAPSKLFYNTCRSKRQESIKLYKSNEKTSKFFRHAVSQKVSRRPRGWKSLLANSSSSRALSVGGSSGSSAGTEPDLTRFLLSTPQRRVSKTPPITFERAVIVLRTKLPGFPIDLQNLNTLEAAVDAVCGGALDQLDVLRPGASAGHGKPQRSPLTAGSPTKKSSILLEVLSEMHQPLTKTEQRQLQQSLLIVSRRLRLNKLITLQKEHEENKRNRPKRRIAARHYLRSSRHGGETSSAAQSKTRRKVQNLVVAKYLQLHNDTASTSSRQSSLRRQRMARKRVTSDNEEEEEDDGDDEINSIQAIRSNGSSSRGRHSNTNSSNDYSRDPKRSRHNHTAVAILDLLTKIEIGMNVLDENRLTPLHYALMNKNPNLVFILCVYGAKFTFATENSQRMFLSMPTTSAASPSPLFSQSASPIQHPKSKSYRGHSNVIASGSPNIEASNLQPHSSSVRDEKEKEVQLVKDELVIEKSITCDQETQRPEKKDGGECPKVKETSEGVGGEDVTALHASNVASNTVPMPEVIDTSAIFSPVSPDRENPPLVAVEEKDDHRTDTQDVEPQKEKEKEKEEGGEQKSSANGTNLPHVASIPANSLPTVNLASGDESNFGGSAVDGELMGFDPQHATLDSFLAGATPISVPTREVSPAVHGGVADKNRVNNNNNNNNNGKQDKEANMGHAAKPPLPIKPTVGSLLRMTPLTVLQAEHVKQQSSFLLKVSDYYLNHFPSYVIESLDIAAREDSASSFLCCIESNRNNISLSLQANMADDLSSTRNKYSSAAFFTPHRSPTRASGARNECVVPAGGEPFSSCTSIPNFNGSATNCYPIEGSELYDRSSTAMSSEPSKLMLETHDIFLLHTSKDSHVAEMLLYAATEGMKFRERVLSYLQQFVNAA